MAQASGALVLAMTEDDVRDMLKRATDKAGGVRAWARQHDLSAAYVSDVRLGRRSLGPAILDALGVEIAKVIPAVTTYKRIRGR